MAFTPETLREIAQAQQAFVWEASEHIHHEKSGTWYIVISLAAFAAVGYGVWTENYLFALIILIAAIILVIAGHEEPRTILAQIGDNGIVVDGKLMDWDHLHNFSIIYHPPFTKVLYFDRKLSFKPRIRLFLEDQDPIAIRNHLLRYLPENLDLRDEHFSDILGRLLKIS